MTWACSACHWVSTGGGGESIAEGIASEDSGHVDSFAFVSPDSNVTNFRIVSTNIWGAKGFFR